MDEEQRQTGIRKTMEGICERIREAEARGAEDAGYYVSRGDYEAAKIVRRRVWEITQHMREDLIDLRTMLPPFTTENDGILCVHPVTPENAHFLREPMR